MEIPPSVMGDQSSPQLNLNNRNELFHFEMGDTSNEWDVFHEYPQLDYFSDLQPVCTGPNFTVAPIDLSPALYDGLSPTFCDSFSLLPSCSPCPSTPGLTSASSCSNTMDFTRLSPPDHSLKWALPTDEETHSQPQLSSSFLSWIDDIEPSSIQLQHQYMAQDQDCPNAHHTSQLYMPLKLQMPQQVQQCQQPQTHIQNQSMIPTQLQPENQQQQYINQYQQSPTNHQSQQHLILPQQQVENQQFQNHDQPAYTSLATPTTQDAISVQVSIESIGLENIQTEVNVSRLSNLKRARSNVSTLSPKGNDKRSRGAISLEEKVKVINYRKQNPSISVQELSRITGVPRSTIYGIFENSEKIISLSRIQPNMSRTIENRFRILETLLSDWSLTLRSRGIKVTNRKLCAQAFEIHRMLSGLLKDPLPQCLFTTGWLKGFKDRRAAHLTIPLSTQDQSQSDKIKDILGKLRDVSKENIYTCDITNMYLDMMPTSVYKSDDPNKPSRRTDSSSVSVLLCCNATGKDMLDPVVLVRQTSNVVGLQGYNGVVLDSDLNNVTNRVVWSWLMRFDNDVEHKVVLLVDQAMYDLFELDKVSGRNLLRFVTVLCVPSSAASYLPMNTRIVKDFKTFYYTLLLKDAREWLRYSESQREASGPSHSYTGQGFIQSSQHRDICPLNTIVSQLRIIPNAWLHVSTSAIESDFQYFLGVAEDLISGGQPRSNSPLEDAVSPERTLKEMLATVYPNLPSTITQHYLSQSNEIGPSCFLRMRILKMRNHEDFTGCFGDSLDFGMVQFATRKLHTGMRFENVEQKRIAHRETDLLENYKRFTSPFGAFPRYSREEAPLVFMFGPKRISTNTYSN